MALYQLTDTNGNRVQVEAPKKGSTKAEILRLYEILAWVLLVLRSSTL